jgi:predicted DNA-binding transcriptional regulator AlpA
MLKIEQVSLIVGYTERTIYRMISAGEFPRADKAIGRKIRLWHPETIRQWCNPTAVAA